MSRDWIIESLAELKAHAKKEGLPALAEQLDIAIRLAVVEMAQPPTHDKPKSSGPRH